VDDESFAYVSARRMAQTVDSHLNSARGVVPIPAWSRRALLAGAPSAAQQPEAVRHVGLFSLVYGNELLVGPTVAAVPVS